MTTAASAKLTYEDYAAIPDDGRRHEIIDGEHYVSPSPRASHQRILRRLLRKLDAHAIAENAGEVFCAPFDVVLSKTDVVQPDLLFISRERMDIVGEANVQAAPDLVVEILSESTRRIDEIVKRKRYEHFGVKEYWIVDPVLESIKIYRREGGAFTRVAELSMETGGRIETPLLPGLAIDVEQIFRD